ncbi:MAG: SCO family protein [Bacteroidia bacterium]|nr:SCO family protein [Bacteroidia bacterium]
MKKLINTISVCLIIFVAACGNSNSPSGNTNSEKAENNNTLPYYGNRSTEVKYVDGLPVVDTVYQSIPSFKFTNQDGNTVTDYNMLGKVSVVDFFFTSCPTICPTMKKEMMRVYDKFKGDTNVIILSHTIDPDYDTKEVLKDYAERLGADGKQWQFLTGKRKDIYSIAEKGYFVAAQKDSTAPGGYIHSGGFVLVDRNLHVRGVYDGTSEEKVNQLMDDIKRLLTEK